jgi:hypothetical protein
MWVIAWIFDTIILAVGGPTTVKQQSRAILQTASQNMADRESAIGETVGIILVISLIVYILRRVTRNQKDA